MREKIARLKKRRDELLSRACNRHERPAVMEEVRRLNRRIAGLDADRGGEATADE